MVHPKINWEESSPIGSLRLNPWAKQRVREVSPNQLVAGRFFLEIYHWRCPFRSLFMNGVYWRFPGPIYR